MNIKHDIWQNPEELTMLCFSDELGEESRTFLEPNSKIIHSFYANSHFDAMTQYYQFMDWGTYETTFKIDKEPYKLDQLKKRSVVRLKIDQILFEDWDPIRINNIAPRDEYRSYVPLILGMVMDKRSKNEIANALYDIETKIIGVIGNKKRCQEIAEKVSSTTQPSAIANKSKGFL